MTKLTALLVVTYLFLVGINVRAQSFETEPNNSISQANPLPLGISVSGQLISLTDIDTFAVTASASGSLTLDFTTQGFSYSVNFLDSSGSILASYNHSYGGKSYAIGLPSSGTYYIQIRSQYSTTYSSDQYTVKVRMDYGNYLSFEREPNNSTMEAQVLRNGLTVNGQLISATDIDTFAVNASANGSLTLEFSTQGFSYTLNFLDPSGSILASYNHSYGSKSYAIGIPSPGTYYIQIKSQYSTSYSSDSYSIKAIFPPTVYISFTTQPQGQAISAGSNVTLSVATSSPENVSFQWRKNNSAIPGATGSTLSFINIQNSDAGSYTVAATNSFGSLTSSAAILTVNGPPTLTSGPVNITVNEGQAATFSATAIGTAPLSYQWFKSNVIVSGATASNLTFGGVQSRDAGSYTVVVTNSFGSITSNAAVLTVRPPLVILVQPQSQTLTNGSFLMLSVTASGGAGPISYQWRFNGVSLANGATSTYSATSVGFGYTGTFDVVVSDGVRFLTSVAAIVNVVPVSRISNLSILTSVTTTDPLFTVGTVIGGRFTIGSKAILVRSAGPSLSQLGVTTACADPKLDLYSGQAVVASNDNWGGTTTLYNAFAQVAAFAYASAASKDAAVYNQFLPSGNYTVQVSGVGGAAGTVIAELYDATPESAFTAATPRLINVSVLKQISAGETLIAGFVISGASLKQVLIRAVGPTLGAAPFNISGVMNNPKLDLYRGQAVINSNDDWGGTSALAMAFSNVGAFMLSTGSRDAVLLVALQPGAYTVQVSGVNGANGVALVEIYEVP